MTDSAISNQLNNMEEPPVVNNQYKPKSIFQEDQSFIDFDTVYNADETINNFYLNETDGIDFSSEEFNKTRKAFTSLTEPADNKENLKGLAKGLGLEVGVGLGADAAYTFIKLGPLVLQLMVVVNLLLDITQIYKHKN